MPNATELIAELRRRDHADLLLELQSKYPSQTAERLASEHIGRVTYGNDGRPAVRTSDGREFSGDLVIPELIADIERSQERVGAKTLAKIADDMQKQREARPNPLLRR